MKKTEKNNKYMENYLKINGYELTKNGEVSIRHNSNNSVTISEYRESLINDLDSCIEMQLNNIKESDIKKDIKNKYSVVILSLLGLMASYLTFMGIGFTLVKILSILVAATSLIGINYSLLQIKDNNNLLKNKKVLENKDIINEYASNNQEVHDYLKKYVNKAKNKRKVVKGNKVSINANMFDLINVEALRWLLLKIEFINTYNISNPVKVEIEEKPKKLKKVLD